MHLTDIQAAIAALPDNEFKQLTSWLTEHDFNRWDAEIVADLDAGRLDTLIEEAQADYKAGLTSPL